MTISASSRPPAITNRSPADQNGGISPRTALTAAAFDPARRTNTANASRTGRDVRTHLRGARYTGASRREVTAHAAIGDERERLWALWNTLDDDYEVAAPAD